MSAPLASVSESELEDKDLDIENLSSEQNPIYYCNHNPIPGTSKNLKNKSKETLHLKIIKQIPNDHENPSTSVQQQHQIQQQQKSIEQLKKIKVTGKPTRKIELKFENITYSVKIKLLSRESKTILNGVSGNFRPGELTAIVGPSGAGKSSLLNILSGYVSHSYSGNVLVNGYPRNLKTFIPQSAYITQDAELQPYLTVSEAMTFAANLKMGSGETKESRKDRVKKILEAIGMYETRHIMTGKLSGGQKKRLSVALELVSNPPILFLDEPTSGLDSVTSTQCISLLKKLAQEGRTIIFTIHQPSALIFGMFDHLFAIAEGQCIYAGGTQNLVPFLSELNLKCPESYNPSDFLIEISTHNYGVQNPKLIEKIQNGFCELYRKTEQTTSEIEVMSHVEKMMESGLMTPIKTPHLSSQFTPTFIPILESSSSSSVSGQIATVTTNIMETSAIKGSSKECNIKPKLPNIQIDPTRLCQIETRYAASFHRQLIILLMRTFLILWRDKSLTLMRIILHAIMGTFVGTLYLGIGDDAKHTLNNLRYIFFSIMFVMYTSFSSVILNFPLEFAMVSREHFNRWYSLRSYYIAITLADFPVQLSCTIIFILISYLLTAQPLELARLLLFALMVVMAALVAQSIGLCAGASMNVTNAAIIGPFFLAPFLAFSGFFVQIKDVGQGMQWLFHISFLKYALEGSSLAIFGYNRPKLQCKDMFCMFTHPQRFLKEICMDESSYEFALLALLIIFLILRVLSFYIMSFRLRLFR